MQKPSEPIQHRTSEEVCIHLLEKYRGNDGKFDDKKATLNVRSQWLSLGCSKRVITTGEQLDETKRGKDHSKPVSPADAENLSVGLGNEDKCKEMQKKYDVVVGTSWGSLPVDLQK